MFHTAVAERLGLGVTDARCRNLLLQEGPMTAEIWPNGSASPPAP